MGCGYKKKGGVSHDDLVYLVGRSVFGGFFLQRWCMISACFKAFFTLSRAGVLYFKSKFLSLVLFS